MSTLSQFFNSATSSGAGGVSYFGTSGSLTVPSDATYIAYGAMGAGACGNGPSGGAGGGFSWWEGAVNCTSPFTITTTVGATAANGGTSIVSGGPTTICATGGQLSSGGIGYCGLINTCGGTNCCGPSVVFFPYYGGCAMGRHGGGAGGLLGNGGPGCSYGGGGGFGSGGGGGQYWGSGGAGGSPGGCLGGSGLNGGIATPGYAISYNLNGKLSQAKTFLSASGGGAGTISSACCVTLSAGAGGGGSGYAPAGFGGGSGGGTNSYIGAGCGGGGSFNYGHTPSADASFVVCTPGGNGFVAVEYWK